MDLQPQTPIPNPTREKILSMLYNRSDLQKIISKLANSSYLREELKAELFLALSTLPEVELLEKYTKAFLDYWIIAWLSNQANSKTSPFYLRIKKYEISVVHSEDKVRKLELLTDNNHAVKQRYLDLLEEGIRKLDWYHQEIIRNYLKLKSIKAVTEATGIRSEYISKAIKESKEQLKNYINGRIKMEA
jgi:hypothetical protein